MIVWKFNNNLITKIYLAKYQEANLSCVTSEDLSPHMDECMCLKFYSLFPGASKLQFSMTPKTAAANYKILHNCV